MIDAEVDAQCVRERLGTHLWQRRGKRSPQGVPQTSWEGDRKKGGRSPECSELWEGRSQAAGVYPNIELSNFPNWPQPGIVSGWEQPLSACLSRNVRVHRHTSWAVISSTAHNTLYQFFTPPCLRDIPVIGIDYWRSLLSQSCFKAGHVVLLITVCPSPSTVVA